MLDCRQASQLISQSLDRPLTLRERFVLKLHLFICEFCRQFRQHMQTLHVTIKTMVDSIENDSNIEMPSDTKKHISELVETHRVKP
jgi:predicted anti-sigma-YlaC factor YlaD